MKLKIVESVLFWGGSFWLGYRYGWELPVALALVLVGVLVTHQRMHHS